MDLGDLWRGRLSLRRLSVLVEHLPSGCATRAAIDGFGFGWTEDSYLLADVFHAVAGMEHPARPKPPKRNDDLVARLKAQRERLAAEQPREDA